MIMITRDGDTSGEDSTDLYRRRIRRALGLDVNGPPDGDELSAMSAACMLVRSELFLLAMDPLVSLYGSTRSDSSRGWSKRQRHIERLFD